MRGKEAAPCTFDKPAPVLSTGNAQERSEVLIAIIMANLTTDEKKSADQPVIVCSMSGSLCKCITAGIRMPCRSCA